MAALLALTAAVAYGAGDFLGGVAARREPATAVVLWSHVVGLLVLVTTAPLIGGEITAPAMLVGAVAGIAGAVGVAAFYKALSLGAMSVVAPITGLLSAAIPVLAGVARGERPEPVALAGIAIALLAIVFVSRETAAADGAEPTGALVAKAGAQPMPGQAEAEVEAMPPQAEAEVEAMPPQAEAEVEAMPPQAGALALALVAGAAFGLFFVVIDGAGDNAGIWPLVAARVASVALFGTLALAGITASGIPRTAAVAALGCGVLDASANALYVLALSQGLLSIVSVLAALYPAGTVLLARYLLGERMSRIQHAGLAFAGCAALLIAA